MRYGCLIVKGFGWDKLGGVAWRGKEAKGEGKRGGGGKGIGGGGDTETETQ